MNRSCYRVTLAVFLLVLNSTNAWQSFATSTATARAKRSGASSELWLAPKDHEESESLHRTVYELNLDDKAVPDLQRRLQLQQKKGVNSEEENELVQVEGYVQSQRNFGPSFCFLDLSRRGVKVPVQAMLKRQEFGDAARFDGFMKSLVPGIRIAIRGPVAPTRNPGEALVLIHDISIQKLPHNPQHVRKLLRMVSDGLLEAKDLTLAANKTEVELLREIRRAKETVKAGHPKIFNGLAKVILESLKEDHEGDLEYPDLTSDHKLTHSLPEAPPEIRLAPRMQQQVDSRNGGDENRAEPLSIRGTLIDHCQNANNSKIEKVNLVTGWVQNRRRFRGSISALEVVDEMVPLGTFEEVSSSEKYANSDIDTQNPDQTTNSFWDQRLKCIIHPKVLECSNTTHAELYGQLCAPGCRIRMIGYIAPEDQSDCHAVAEKPPVFWVREIALLSSSWRPSVVQFLLEQVVARKFNLMEAAQALKISHQEMGRIVGIDDLTKRQWEGVEIARRLQQQTMDLSLHVDPKALDILNSFESLRAKYPLDFVDAAESDNSRTDFVSTQGSRWKRKKEPQLDWMCAAALGVLKESYPDRFHGSNDDKPLRILDVGGGKGFLANHLARRLLDLGCQVEILVLDVAEGAIHNGRLRSERRNMSHIVQYAVADASTADLSKYGDVDLVVALHACGALTDVALGHAVNQQAAFVICPCCFKSNPRLTVPTLPLPEEVAKDGITVEKFLNVDPRAYDKIKGLAEVQGDIKLANRAIHAICALRSAAVEKRASIPMNVSVRTFPVVFSTRNFCLVGAVL